MQKNSENLNFQKHVKKLKVLFLNDVIDTFSQIIIQDYAASKLVIQTHKNEL